MNTEPLTVKRNAEIRKESQDAIKDEDALKEVFVRLDRGLVSGPTGFPTKMSQDDKKIANFTKEHPAFATWKEPAHGWDEQKYFALLVPQLVELACTDPETAKGIARRANSLTRRNRKIVPEVPNLAKALLDAPCFKALKLPDDLLERLKKQRARQETK